MPLTATGLASPTFFPSLNTALCDSTRLSPATMPSTLPVTGAAVPPS